jgi:hypothetical protein
MARTPTDRVRRLALALSGAYEKLSHGEPTFWAGRRMFATFADAANHHGAGRHAVWCRSDHVTQDLLVAQSPERYFKPPYVGPSGWVGIYLDRSPDWSAVAERLRHAHELAASTRTPRTRAAGKVSRKALSPSDSAIEPSPRRRRGFPAR